MSNQTKHFYDFGPFRLDLMERLLPRDGVTIALTPKAFELLLTLVEEHGHLLEKEELLKRVWPDTFIEEGNLSYNISIIRKALGDGENGLKFIETVPKRGYRFVGEVRKTDIERQRDGDAEQEIVPRRSRIAFSPRWFLVMIAPLLVLALAVYYFWSQRTVTPVTPAPIKSLAVLPFKSLQANSGDEYLGLGLADTLITKLGGLRQLIVRPTSAIRKYSNAEQDPLDAGREQQVQAVLDAHMQRVGDKLRVTVRLLKVNDGETLWAYQCDEQLCADLFLMQDMIAEKVAAKLASHLTAEDRRRLSKHYTENRAAHMSYNQGRRFAEKRTAEAWQKAIESYQQALDLDPNYALAYVGLADAYYHSPLEPSNVGMPRSKAAATRALALDETLGEAHAALALILYQYEWKWPEAEREFKRALELDPGNAYTHRIYSYYLSSMGQHDESIAQMKQAQQIDPLSPILNLDIGQMLYFAGQIGPATEQFQLTQRMEPNFPEAYERLGMGYAQLGKYEEAVVALDKAMALEKDNVDAIAILGYTYSRWGKRGEALKRVDELRELSTRRNVSAFWPALIYAGLGDKDQAFPALQRACQERFRYLVYLKVEIRFKSLHTDPRFAELVRCVGLPQ